MLNSTPSCFRHLHSSHRWPLPADRCAHGATRPEDRGSSLSVQSQHPEAGLCWVLVWSCSSIHITSTMQLQQLRLSQPGSVSEAGRPRRSCSDRRKARHLSVTTDPLIFQCCAPVRRPYQTVVPLFLHSRCGDTPRAVWCIFKEQKDIIFKIWGKKESRKNTKMYFLRIIILICLCRNVFIC